MYLLVVIAAYNLYVPDALVGIWIFVSYVPVDMATAFCLNFVLVES